MNETRNIILLSALRLFLQKGYREVTMNDILESSGQAKGTFYYHFKDKETVFEEAAKYFIANYIVVSFSRIPRASLAEFITAYLRVKARNAQKMTLLGSNSRLLVFISRATMSIKALRELMDRQEKEEGDAWNEVLANSRKSGEIDTVLTDGQVTALFRHTYQGLRSEQFKSMLSHAEVLTMIERDWKALYELIKK